MARVNRDLSNLFVVQPILLSGPGEGAIKLGEVVIGWFADDVPVELAQTLLVLSQGVRLVQALLYFKVGFPAAKKTYLFPIPCCIFLCILISCILRHFYSLAGETTSHLTFPSSSLMKRALHEKQKSKDYYSGF